MDWWQRRRLRSGRSWARNEAAAALGKSKSPGNIALLAERLANDSNSSVRMACVHALGKSDDESAIAALAGGLKDSDSWIAAETARMLGEKRTPLCEQQLMDCLRTANNPEKIHPVVQALAGWVQGDIGAVLIERASSEESETIKHACVAAMKHVDSPQVTQYLIRSLLEQDELRGHALGAIAAKEGEEILPTITEMMLSDKSQKYRNEAFSILKARTPQQATQVLLEAIEKDGDRQHEYMERLSGLGAAAVDPIIEAHNKSKYPFWLETALARISAADATPMLLGGLEHTKEKIRSSCAAALPAMPASSAIAEALVQRALHDDSDKVRDTAAASLKHYPEEADKAFIALLLPGGDEPAPFVIQERAMQGIIVQGKTSRPERVHAALHSPDLKLRAMAAKAVGIIGYTDAGDSLIELLKTPDAPLRHNAAEALGELRYSQAMEPLCTLAETEKNGTVQRALAEALGKLGNGWAVPVLGRMATQSDDFMGRREAVEALHDIKDKSAEEALIQAAQDKETRVRKAAVKALADLGSEKCAPQLALSLKEEDFDVRQAAVDALGAIGAHHALPQLQEIFIRDEYMRDKARAALVRSGGPQAVAGFFRALTEDDEQVREKAGNSIDALLKMVTPEQLKPHLELFTSGLAEENEMRRLYAVRTLGHIADPASASLMALTSEQDAADLPSTIEHNTQRMIRSEAKFAFRRICHASPGEVRLNDARILPALCAFVSEESTTPEEVKKAMQEKFSDTQALQAEIIGHAQLSPPQKQRLWESVNRYCASSEAVKALAKKKQLGALEDACETALQQPQMAQEAQAVLQHLTLVRGSQQPLDAQKDVLLRPASDEGQKKQPADGKEWLLRASQANGGGQERKLQIP